MLVLNRLSAAYRAWPDLAGWRDAGLLFLAFALLAIPLGYWSGLLRLHRAEMSAAQLAGFALLTLFIPSLLEETLFRVLLLPHRAEAAAPAALWLWGLGALALFVAAHPLNAWLLRPAARPVFYAPSFLLLAGLLGAACTLAYLRTGSIWPPVLMHWAAVVLWKAFLGGPAPLFGA
ncbi:MAG: CPBP family glutamic-type intramembrane protease [Planctomycetota bacterium]|nr:CPBP family glutamic-type intramembrane protease [Planctomycetota bacterium]